jgi:hypothetical protein
MEARNLTAELKVFREVGATPLAIRYRPSETTRLDQTTCGDRDNHFRLFEYLVERASTALAKRIKGNARPPTAARINP